jgi:alpha-1,3-rhamnosyl/mannosyltransferase
VPPGPDRTRHRIGLNMMWLVPGVVGGSEEYTTRLLGAIAAESTPDLDLVLFVNSSFPRSYPDLVSTYRTHVAPVSGRRKGVRVAAETTWLAVRSRQLDLELMHHMGGILPAWRPTPCVLTIHDLQPLVLPEHFAVPKRIFNGIAVPRSVRAAPYVVTLTAYTKRDLVDRLGIDPDRVIVVPPGFGSAAARIEGTDGRVVRAVYGLDDRPFFLFPAITYPHKNHLMLLEAFAALHERHPEAMLVLTSGEAQMGSAVTEAIDRLGLAGHVRRLGRIPERDLVALYREATALTFPSRYEGFGLPVLEAMSCGCAVLASDATALPEAVGGAGVLLPPSDPSAWTAAMAELLTNPARVAELAAAGTARIAAFDWHVSAACQIDVYRRAIRDRG